MFLNPGRRLLARLAIFDFLSFILKDNEVLATIPFSEIPGNVCWQTQLFKIRITSQIVSQFKNQRIFEFWEPSAFKSYSETHRIESDTIFFLIRYGKCFLITFKLLSQLKKNRRHEFLRRCSRHYFSNVEFFFMHSEKIHKIQRHNML